jgi:hypothetical protein
VDPEILDASGSALDQDGDGIALEMPEDQYTVSFVITAPKVRSHMTPHGRLTTGHQSCPAS